jgi:hypothetical protein
LRGEEDPECELGVVHGVSSFAVRSKLEQLSKLDLDVVPEDDEYPLEERAYSRGVVLTIIDKSTKRMAV